MSDQLHNQAGDYYANGINREVVAAHNISESEYETLITNLGRAPNFDELGIYSALWSEHCSYKSTKVLLKTLPTKGDAVIHGPGENAGAVKLDDDTAVIFKIESHNHPSYIEPFQGAATGVGGIMRDVFAMGARPVANLNVLHFGAPDHPKTKNLVSGVVSGIGFYGNCTGVPTVAGETGFDAGFNGNILVNAMCVGIAEQSRIFTAKADKVGSSVMYVGGRTGRDGVKGAVMASAIFDSDVEDDQRPAVQVGDPYLEKLLIEATLELMQENAILAVQDMGAAGIASSSVEMAAKGGVGIYLDLDKVPCRGDDITAYEMMLSESQERMLLILDPTKVDVAEKIFNKWGLEAIEIGIITKETDLVVRHHGETVINLPIFGFEAGSPEYNRPYVLPTNDDSTNYELIVKQKINELDYSNDLESILLRLMGNYHLCSKNWISEQYDNLVGGLTTTSTGGDAAVVRVRNKAKMAFATCVDSSPRYCSADPKNGALQCVAEARRNLISVGASPLAVTNNLNFGNPEVPEIMGQIVSAVEGIKQACEFFNMPVVSGNVSLYNATDGKSIPPTPVIGAVGKMDDWSKAVSLGFKKEGDAIFLIGNSNDGLSQSLLARDILNFSDGPPPMIDLHQEKIVGEIVLSLIEKSAINAVHDISDGGLLVAIAEMCLAGNLGAEIKTIGTTDSRELIDYFFNEGQARFVVAAPPGHSSKVLELCRAAKVSVQHLGMVSGHRIIINNDRPISLSKLKMVNESTLPELMS